MATLTEDRSTPTSPNPTEVVVRVDAGRRRRPSLIGTVLLAGIAVLLVVGLAFASGLLNFGNLFSTRTTDRSAPVILHKLQNLSSYNAAAGTFSVTVDVEKDVSILPQFIAGSRVIYSGYGTVDASVDLGALSATNMVRRPDGTLVVTLPHAKLGRAVLDPERSHVMNRDRGLLDRIGGVFVDNPTSERALERAAMTKMSRAAEKTDLIGRAERNTETMIQRLGAAAGVQQVDVRFTNSPA